MSRDLSYYKRRYQRAYGLAMNWWALLETAQRYCIPERNLFYYTNQNQGAQKNAKVYDTTAIAATRNFVSKVQRALTPPQQIWAKLEAGSMLELSDNDKERLAEYLQKSTQIVFDYIRQSNFDCVINECYYDLALGTAALVCNEGTDDNPLQFMSIPLCQLAFEESCNGRIESAYRTWGETKVSEIEILWPNARIPDYLLQALDKEPNATVKGLYEGVVYCHGDKKPYKYVVWTDNDKLLEEEYLASPWIIFRWSKANTEVMGRGPVLEALPSILSLNKLFELEFAASAFNTFKPVMAYSDGVFNANTFRIAPNSVIPIAPSPDGSPPVVPFPDAGQPMFAQLLANELRQQINTILFANPIGDIEDTPTKTATEITIRQKNLAEEIGPLFTRLQQEFLAPTIQRVIDILQARAIIEPLDIDGKLVKLKYQSPLVIAQGQQDVETFMAFVQVAQSTFGPENAIKFFDKVNCPVWLAEKLGVDKETVLTREELQEFYNGEDEAINEQVAIEREVMLKNAAR